mgnify:CR=1 FL=1
MSINTIGFDPAPQGVNRSQDRLDRLASQAGSAAQSGGVTSEKAGQLTIARTAPEYQRLTALHERSNAVAATIRTMDQAMEAAGTTIDAMKKELEVVSKTYPCLLYTSDAADERSSVDLGGLRIIKKKNRKKI